MLRSKTCQRVYYCPSLLCVNAAEDIVLETAHPIKDAALGKDILVNYFCSLRELKCCPPLQASWDKQL